MDGVTSEHVLTFRNYRVASQNIILPYIAMKLGNLYSALNVDNFISWCVQMVKTKLVVTNCQYYFMKGLSGWIVLLVLHVSL